jgi:predicted Holliday junction resolvase-like endonuclease
LTETIKNQLAEINSLKYELAKKVCSLDYQLKKEKNNNYALKEQLSSSENTLKNREAYWKEVDIAFSNYKNKFDSLFQENRLLKQQLEKASQHEKEE